MGRGTIMWLITCLLHVCSAICCEPAVCLVRQHVYSNEIRCCCLPIGLSCPPPLLCLPEVHLADHVRAKPWHQHVTSPVLFFAFTSFSLSISHETELTDRCHWLITNKLTRFLCDVALLWQCGTHYDDGLTADMVFLACIKSSLLSSL